MLREESSSYSLSESDNDNDNDNFDQEIFKKVTYQGKFSDSEREDSRNDQSDSHSSRKDDQIERKITNNKSSDLKEKSKPIKKNCESAKMSRQRKRVYLQLLEQKAHSLIANISSRKSSIKKMSDRILHKFNRSNRDKYNFLVKKLALSKQLLKMTKQVEDIKKIVPNPTETQQEKQTTQNEKANEMSLNISPEENQEVEKGGMEKEEEPKPKAKRRRGKEMREQNAKIQQQNRIIEKEKSLDLGVSAYMYEFGVKGSLRSDVIERSKYQWFQTLQKSKIQPTQQLVNKVKNMKTWLQQLDGKGKKLDYYLRELKDRVKGKFSVQFLLDRQFFTHNNSETIYKNINIAGTEPNAPSSS